MNRKPKKAKKPINVTGDGGVSVGFEIDRQLTGDVVTGFLYLRYADPVDKDHRLFQLRLTPEKMRLMADNLMETAAKIEDLTGVRQ